LAWIIIVSVTGSFSSEAGSASVSLCAGASVCCVGASVCASAGVWFAAQAASANTISAANSNAIIFFIVVVLLSFLPISVCVFSVRGTHTIPIWLYMHILSGCLRSVNSFGKIPAKILLNVSLNFKIFVTIHQISCILIV